MKLRESWSVGGCLKDPPLKIRDKGSVGMAPQVTGPTGILTNFISHPKWCSLLTVSSFFDMSAAHYGQFNLVSLWARHMH